MARTNAMYYKDDGNTRYYCNAQKSGYSYWSPTPSEWPEGKFCVTELNDGIFWFPYESRYLFKGATNTTFDTTNWYVSPSDVGKTSFQELFSDCRNLESIDVHNILNAGVHNVSLMFSWCDKLINVNLVGADTSNVWNFSTMFHCCQSIEEIDISTFDTSKGTTFSGMFQDCYKLRTIYASSDMSMASKESDENMFDGCHSIRGGNGTTYDWDLWHEQDSRFAKIDRPGTRGYLTNVNYKGKNNIYQKEDGSWQPKKVYINNSEWSNVEVYLKDSGNWQYIYQE